MFETENDNFEKKLRQLRRSPKIGAIYELYREEMQNVSKDTTCERQNKAWLNHLSLLQNVRADKITPLSFQRQILNPIYHAQHYANLLYVTRLALHIIKFAKACHLIDNNPLDGIFDLPLVKKTKKKAMEKSQHRPTLPHDNIQQHLKRVIKDFYLKGNLRRQYLLEISLRTILRPGEVVKLKITDLNIDEHLIKVMQPKSKDVFYMPTSPRLEEIIKQAHSLFGNDQYIFQGQRDKTKHLSSQTMNKALKDLGYKGLLCAHGLRSVASNILAQKSSKVHPWVREAMLQHVVGSNSERCYRHYDYLQERRKSGKLYDDYLNNIYRKIYPDFPF